MNLKANLFVKIFVGFWLVTTLILGSWLLAARYFESLPDRPPAASHPGPPGPPRQFMLRLFYELQNVADSELPQLLRKTRQQHNIDVFLLNSKGEELYHRELVPGVLEVAEQLRGRQRRRMPVLLWSTVVKGSICQYRPAHNHPRCHAL